MRHVFYASFCQVGVAKQLGRDVLRWPTDLIHCWQTVSILSHRASANTGLGYIGSTCRKPGYASPPQCWEPSELKDNCVSNIGQSFNMIPFHPQKLDLWRHTESTRLGLSFKLPAGNNADVLSDPWAWRANPSSLAWCPLPRYEVLRPWLGAGVTVGLSFWAKEELARQPLLPTVLWSSTPTIVLTQWKCMEMFHWWYFQM